MATRELVPVETGIAFGETLGLDVPTQYTEEIHRTVNALIAVDALVTPQILGMSAQTVWMGRFVAGLLLLMRSRQVEAPLRQRLEVEAGVGVIMMLMAFRGMITRNAFERLYLMFAGALIVANSMMTRVE